MSWWTLRPSRLSVCAVVFVALAPIAILGGPGARSAEPTPYASEQATADEEQPLDPPDTDAPIDLGTDTVIARIGPTERILLGDVIGDVNKQFAKTSRRFPREQRPMLLNQLVHQHVLQLIPFKVLLCEVRRKVLKEDLDKVWKQVEDIFDDRILPVLLEERELDTAAALDAQLKSEGSSLEKQKQKFVEEQLALQFLCDHAMVDEEVAPDDLYDFYQAHYEEYDIKAKVRWEQLLVKFAGRTKQEARQLIGDMANQVSSGVPWTLVAKAQSEGSTHAAGGKRDWTNQGSLKFAALDQALFELPVGAMSPVLENEDSVQVVRVVERTPARVIPLDEKQSEIKKVIVDERVRKAKEKFVRKLVEDYRPRIWTVFDDGGTVRIPSPPGS